MHVALATLTNGGISGGARKHLEALVPRMACHPQISRLDLFVPPGLQAGFQRNSPYVWETWDSGDVYTGFRKLGVELQRRQPDVVFVPNARWLNCGTIPVVAMVHNMEPMTFRFRENSMMDTLRMMGRVWVARDVCRRATRVIAVSGFVRQHLEERWGVSPEKVTTIYHGADMPCEPMSMKPPAALRCLSVPFLLAVGSIRPYRRLEDLVQAYAILARQSPGIPVVVAGGVDAGTNFYFQRLKALATQLGVENQFIWAGMLDANELSWCYAKCAAFVMTSRVEACPNTVLEAMAHGCLSVSTDAAPMPEMYGDSAMFYADQQPHHLALQLQAALSLSPAEQQIYREKSRNRAGQFTWQKTTDLTVRLLANATKTNARDSRKAA